MKLLAARMKYALIVVPAAASQMVARCIRGQSMSRPKIHRPRNVDSRKKAISPSIASGAPKMSPTKREYCDQFMPNWNSCTMPVTTPRANSTSMILVQNRVARSQYLAVGCAPLAVGQRRHHRDERGQPDRERDDEEVVHRCRRELPACQHRRVHGRSLQTDFISFGLSSRLTRDGQYLPSPYGRRDERHTPAGATARTFLTSVQRVTSARKTRALGHTVSPLARARWTVSGSSGPAGSGPR